MRKRMKRYLSLCLPLCMLVMATPPIGLAEDGTATVAAAEQAAVLEPQAAADATDITPAAAAAPDLDATPEPEDSAAPLEEPTSVDSKPSPVGIEEMPPLEKEASDDPAMLEAAEITITNDNGTLSDTLPEGVTVKEQQWWLNSNPISGATDTTYKLIMNDMKNKDNVLYVRLTLGDGGNGHVRWLRSWSGFSGRCRSTRSAI